jgi:hypothetical protein
MDADDVILNTEVSEKSDCQGPDCYIRKCPTDGFIQFSEVIKLENQEVCRAVLLDESKKEIATGFFHEEEIEFGDMVHVRIFHENDSKDKYLVYYNATSKSYGFMFGGSVWIPKNMMATMTTRTIRGVADGRMVTLKCKCGSELVLAVGLQKTLAVCSKCKHIDHVV